MTCLRSGNCKSTESVKTPFPSYLHTVHTLFPVKLSLYSALFDTVYTCGRGVLRSAGSLQEPTYLPSDSNPEVLIVSSARFSALRRNGAESEGFQSGIYRDLYAPTFSRTSQPLTKALGDRVQLATTSLFLICGNSTFTLICEVEPRRSIRSTRGDLVYLGTPLDHPSGTN